MTQERVGEWLCIERGPVKDVPMFAGCTQEVWLHDSEEYLVGIIGHVTAESFTAHVTSTGQTKLHEKLVVNASTRDDAWRKAMRAVELYRELESL